MNNEIPDVKILMHRDHLISI